MRDYELVLLIRPEITEESFAAVQEKIKQMIAAAGGNIAEVNNWGRRKMAYPIGKSNEATYMLIRLHMDTKEVSRLEGGLRLMDEVIRYLVVRTEERKKRVAAVSATVEGSKEQGDGQS